MKNDIDIINEIVKIDLERLDDCMRQVAFANCETIPRDNPFCDKAKKCIMRGMINIFWTRMATLN